MEGIWPTPIQSSLQSNTSGQQLPAIEVVAPWRPPDQPVQLQHSCTSEENQINKQARNGASNTAAATLQSNAIKKFKYLLGKRNLLGVKKNNNWKRADILHLSANLLGSLLDQIPEGMPFDYTTLSRDMSTEAANGLQDSLLLRQKKP